MKYKILLILLFLIVACDQGETSESRTTVQPVEQPAKDATAEEKKDDTGPTCTAGDLLEAKSCKASISNSATATQEKFCKANSEPGSFEACVLESCLPGYLKIGNECVAEVCTANSELSAQVCDIEIPNSELATKSRTCNSAGTDIVLGECIAQTCENGYLLQDNTCIPLVCNANESHGEVNCTDEAPNSATATKTKTCNADGTDYDYGSCIVTACQEGHYLENGICVAQTCTPSAEISVDCQNEIANSLTAEKLGTCNAEGSGYDYGTCVLDTCQDGFYDDMGACSAQECTPNEILSPVSCTDEIPHSTFAERTRTCNENGSGHDLGSCIATECETGYEVRNDTCVALVTYNFHTTVLSLYEDGTPVGDDEGITLAAGEEVVISMGLHLDYTRTDADGNEAGRALGNSRNGVASESNRTYYIWEVSDGELTTSGIYNGIDYKYIAPATAGTYTLTVTAADYTNFFGSVVIDQEVRDAANGLLTVTYTITVVE